MTHRYPDQHHDTYSKTVFGFWLYLMTDCILFAALFATYAVLYDHTAGGPSGRDLFDMPFVLTETLILLTSSFTCSLAMTHSSLRSRRRLIAWFAVTFFLGWAFLWMEMQEFSRLIALGASWQKSAFLSIYFTLLGTHGLHILLGLLYMIVLIGQVCNLGLTTTLVMRLTCLRLFWLLLDVIWVVTYTVVYLLGVS